MEIDWFGPGAVEAFDPNWEAGCGALVFVVLLVTSVAALDATLTLLPTV